MNQVSIYVLKSPVDQSVGYVGKSKNPGARYNQHLKEATSGLPSAKAEWIRRILNNGNPPAMEIIEICSAENAPLREKYWIDFYDITKLTNAVSPMPGDCIQVSLRMTHRVYKILKSSADRNGRSLNGEAIQAIVEYCQPDNIVARIEKLERDQARIHALLTTAEPVNNES